MFFIIYHVSAVVSQETEGNEVTICLDKCRIRRRWVEKKNKCGRPALFCVAAEMKSLFSCVCFCCITAWKP